MTRQIERIQRLADETMSCTTSSELGQLMAETAKDLGADHYLMIHHADFSRGPTNLVRLGNYPDEFMSISRQRGQPLTDPIMEACERTLTGFFWSDVENLVPMAAGHRPRIEEVSQTGLTDGFVVPTHIPGEHLGSCHFATRDGRTLPRGNAAALQSVAVFGFEAARRLAREVAGEVTRHPPLTDRQRECVLLSAQGKSDSVIAQLLGLSPKTVNSYVEAAKRRYGVATSKQLIVSALFASDITFHEIVEAPRHERAALALH